MLTNHIFLIKLNANTKKWLDRAVRQVKQIFISGLLRRRSNKYLVSPPDSATIVREI